MTLMQHGNGLFNGAVGASALVVNITGFSNNAVGNSALFCKCYHAQNTAIGDEHSRMMTPLRGTANFNTAVGASAMFFNDGGGQNTVVGTGARPKWLAGFNNTYFGQFVGSTIGDEDSTIRIADISSGAVP